MSHTVTNRTSRLAVVLVLATLAFSAMASTPAQAQLTVYKVEGTVYSPHFQPLKGAIVTIYTMAGAKSGTATTDAAGKYSIGSLSSGKYNLSVADACCPSYWVPIDIAGTDPTVQQNVVLGQSKGSGPLVLKGIAKDEKSGKPLANVRLELWSFPMMQDTAADSSYQREDRQNAITGADGSYSFNLEAGSVSLAARLEGYDALHASFPLEASRSVDLPMRAASQAAVTISGTIKGPDGAGIPYAWVNVQPDYECNGDVCSTSAQPVESSGSSSNSSNDVSFWYEPAGSQYASTNTDANGKYSLQTTAGRLVLSANADQYVENRTKFSASNGEKKTVNLVLERLPPDSVQVSGTVVDAESGKPIPYAQLSLENQRWGHYNSTMTKEDGQFSFNTKPGYTLLSISAEQQYWMPCTYEASDDPAATSGFAPGEPYPCADGGQRSRDRGYFSVVLSLADGAKTQGLAIKLQPRPAANAELKGYVVNASDQKALPGVQVHFFNEYTRDWGTATTDEFGSFKIKVHAGYYTVRAYAEHYFDGVANVQVQEDESKRVDVPLTPGEKRYGGCCYAMGHSDMGYASKSSSAGGPEPMSVQTVAPQTGSEGSGRDESGSASYKGEGGGLGPYQPLTEPKSGGTSPGASVGLLVAALLALALVRRRSV